MVGRFTSKSEVVFGPPHTFGWVRCPALDANGLKGAGSGLTGQWHGYGVVPNWHAYAACAAESIIVRLQTE